LSARTWSSTSPRSFRATTTSSARIFAGRSFLGDPNASAGRFAVYTSLDFAPKSGGARVTHEEVGLYTVKNDKVTREEFFYAGEFI
jgi:hypothetical protein